MNSNLKKIAIRIYRVPRLKRIMSLIMKKSRVALTNLPTKLKNMKNQKRISMILDLINTTLG